ncbi:putative phage tail protein [Actinoplanes sp. NPDC051851]|uniref:putative phage tail protein n=1 Tax=Actinoplanes sp. NPDC051851 TaxID=3154753 RepID=UPI0034130CE3
MASVTIHNLEVRFQVDGDDHAVFRQLFERHIQAWMRAYEQQCRQSERSRHERALGDREAR